MSALSKEVSLIFRGVDDTSAAIDSVLKGTNQLAGNLQSVVDPAANATKFILKFEAAVVAVGIAVAAYATKVAGDFDAGFREIATLIDVPIEALDDFRQSLIDYQADSTASFDQINNAVYGAISAGIDYTNALSAVRTAEELSIATNSELGTTVATVAAVMNAYGLEVEDQARIQDLFFTIVKNGITTFPELQASIGQVIPIASAAGVEFDEVGAALATLTAQGQKTPQAVTNLTSAISALLNPSAQAAALAAELGVELGASALATNGLQGQMQILEQATGGNVEQLAQLVGSSTALQATLALTGGGAALFSDNLDAMADSAGAAAAAAETMRPALQNLEAPLSAFFITLGTPFLDPFRDAIDSIGNIINAFTASLSDSDGLGAINDIVLDVVRELVTQLDGLAANLADALSQADFSSFVQGIDVLTSAVRGLFDGLDLTSVDNLVTAIESIGTAFLGLSTFSAAVIDSLGPVVIALGEVALALPGLFEGFAELAGTIGAVSVVISSILPLLTGLVGVIVTLKGAGAVAGAITALAGLSTAIGGVAAVLTGPVGLTLLAVGTGAALIKAFKEPRADAEALGETINLTASEMERYIQLAERSESLANEQITAIRQIIAANDDFLNSLSDIPMAVVAAAEAFDDLGTVNFGEALTVDEFDQFIGAVDSRRASLDVSLDAMKDGVREFADEWGISVADAEQIIRDANLDFDQAGAAVQRLRADFFNPFSDELDKVDQLSRDFGISMNEAFAAIGDADGNLDKARQNLKDLGLKMSEAGSAANIAKVPAENLSDELRRMGESGDVAKDKIAELQVELAKAELVAAVEFDIAELEAGTERLRIEAETWQELARIEGDIEIANIEATTERIKDAFGSIDNIFETTSDTIDGLITAMLGVDDADRNAREKIQVFTDALDRQIGIQEQAADNQSKLIDAQVKELDARTNRLRSGDALIQIDGSGLEPELESFMFRILSNIQLRANAEASALLLGI